MNAQDEHQRLRKALLDIQRLKYVTPHAGHESLLAQAILIASKALNTI